MLNANSDWNKVAGMRKARGVCQLLASTDYNLSIRASFLICFHGTGYLGTGRDV